MEIPRTITASQTIRMSPRVSTAVVFIASLAVIIALKYGHWREIPYWDAAFSVFPAGLTLAEMDFDYPRLFRQPGYDDGGPNIHSNSLLTVVIALTTRLIPDTETAFLVLHLMQYVLAAATIALVYRWCIPLLGRAGALLAAGATLSYPMFLAQSGMMYLELPCTFILLMALTTFQAGKVVQASLWAMVAVAIKEPGIMVAGALAASALLRPAPLHRRLLFAAGVAAPSLAVLAVHFMVHAPAGDRQTYVEFIVHAWYFLKSVPDLVALLFASALILLASVPSTLRTWTSPIQRDEVAREAISRRALTHIAIGMFAAFYLTVPFIGTVYVLPRYYLPIVPLLLVAVADAAARILGRRAMYGFLGLVLAASVMNHSGRFYPYVPGNNGSTAERSAEYVDVLTIHRELMAAAEQLPTNTPVFYGLPEHYFSSYPTMGYVSKPFANGHCILHSPKRHALRSRADSIPQFPLG